MLRSVHIENFRALREFRMSGLGRVNLLVGTNNCGKTSILEAIHILAERGDAEPAVTMLARRRETVGSSAELRHLVNGHRLVDGPLFAVAGATDAGTERVEVSLGEAGSWSGEKPSAVATFSWSCGDEYWSSELPLGRGGLVLERPPRLEEERPRVAFVPVTGLPHQQILNIVDAAVLTPDESLILKAMQTVEADVERIATVGSNADASNGRGVVMMVARDRIPAGSMGDGVLRLLGLAGALVQARGGVFLVDEIDGGLHYTVLTKMWRLVCEAAKQLDVQVFATTHSRDCYEALAEVAAQERHDLSLQRVERGRQDAIAFSESELRLVGERGLEVR